MERACFSKNEMPKIYGNFDKNGEKTVKIFLKYYTEMDYLNCVFYIVKQDVNAFLTMCFTSHCF